MCPICCSGGVVLYLAVLASCQAQPEPGLPCADDVRLSIVVILANEKDDKVCPRLVEIARAVQRTHPKLTGFRIVRTDCVPVDVGKEEQFKLVEGQVVKVVVVRAADETNKVSLKVQVPKLGEVSYTTCCGKFFPLVSEYRTKDQEQLIVAIRVQPCKEK